MYGRFFLDPSLAKSPPRPSIHHRYGGLFYVGSAERRRHAGERYNDGDYTYLQLAGVLRVRDRGQPARIRSDGYSSWVGRLSVCLKSHFTYGASVRHKNAVTYSAGNEGQKFVGINCVQELCRETSEKANFRLTRGQLSPLDTQRSARGCPKIVNNIQPCPKRCILMPLARVGARTDSTTRYVQLQREAWPISAHAHWHSTQDVPYFAPRVLHFSAFYLQKFLGQKPVNNGGLSIAGLHVAYEASDIIPMA